jgi:hypothetical protein
MFIHGSEVAPNAPTHRPGASSVRHQTAGLSAGFGCSRGFVEQHQSHKEIVVSGQNLGHSTFERLARPSAGLCQHGIEELVRTTAFITLSIVEDSDPTKHTSCKGRVQVGSKTAMLGWPRPHTEVRS